MSSSIVDSSVSKLKHVQFVLGPAEVKVSATIQICDEQRTNLEDTY